MLTDRTVTLPLSDSQIVGYLVGDKGATARELQRVSHCSCQFSSKTESPSVRLTGSQDEIEVAKHFVEAKLEQYERENKTVKLPELGIPLLLNNQARELQSIQRNTHTRITIDKEQLLAVVRGKAENVSKACSQLKDLLSSLTSVTFALAPQQRGRFMGAGGRNVSQYRHEFHVSVRVEESQIVIEGVQTQVDAASKKIQSWLDANSVMNVECDKDILGRIIIGNKGAIVSQLEKDLHVRIVQETIGSVCVMGVLADVKHACSVINQRILDYQSTHSQYIFTPNHFSFCPELSRVSIDNYRSQYPHLTFTVNLHLSQLRVEGDDSELSSFNAFFQPFVTRTATWEVTHFPVVSTQCGVILGHQGQRIQQLQSHHDVILRLDREGGDLTIWGSKTAAASVIAEIRNLIELYEIVRSEHSVTSAQLGSLLVDRCRPITEIQRVSHATVVLPSPDVNEKTRIVRISGTRPNLRVAENLFESFLEGRYSYTYSYSATVLTALLSSPSFHLERLSLAHQCCISTDSRGNIEIRGEYSGVHATHAELFQALSTQEPSLFGTVVLTDGAAYALANNRCRLTVACEGATITPEPAEKAVYITGTTEAVSKAIQATQTAVNNLSARYVLIPVDTALLAYVIGSKGRRIHHISAECGASVEVVYSNNAVLVSGNPLAVKSACEAVEQALRETQELNAVLRPSAEVLTVFLATYRDLLKQWEREYGGKVTIDEPRGLVRIHGDTAESARGLRYVIESMLEAVELEEEKDDRSRIVPLAPAGDNEVENDGSYDLWNLVTTSKLDHAQRIESLLGLDRTI